MIFLWRSNKYLANSEKSNTFAILNQKVYLQCLFQTWFQADASRWKANRTQATEIAQTPGWRNR